MCCTPSVAFKRVRVHVPLLVNPPQARLLLAACEPLAIAHRYIKESYRPAFQAGMYRCDVLSLQRNRRMANKPSSTKADTPSSRVDSLRSSFSLCCAHATTFPCRSRYSSRSKGVSPFLFHIHQNKIKNTTPGGRRRATLLIHPSPNHLTKKEG